MSQNSDTLTDLNPKVEELKQQLDAKQAQIMEVGGNDYRQLKEDLDKIIQLVAETERVLNKNKHTVTNSTGNLRKLDQEIKRGEEAIERLNEEKDQLAEKVKQNEVTGRQLLNENEQVGETIKERKNSLEEKKNDFLSMKREMAEIDEQETNMKEELDKLMKERQVCKEKCDRIKQNIRSNRLKFIKNVEEFGEDNELEDEPEGEEGKEG